MESTEGAALMEWAPYVIGAQTSLPGSPVRVFPLIYATSPSQSPPTTAARRTPVAFYRLLSAFIGVGYCLALVLEDGICF
jgi:hypothetical protein